MKHLENLRKEKLKLKAEVASRKIRLQQLSEELSKQSGRMVINSLLPFDNDQRQKVNDAFDSVNHAAAKFFGKTKNNTESSPALKSIQMIAAGLAYRYFRKWLKKG